MKRYFAIVLLFGALAMNMDMMCKILCMAGHGGMAHASHNMAKHEAPQGEMCPVKHNNAHQSHHDMPQTSIKCNCSSDQTASVGFELTSADAALDVTPYLHIVSRIQPTKNIFLSKESTPLEGPPKIFA